MNGIYVLKPVPEGIKAKLLYVINVVEQAYLDLKKKENKISDAHSLTKVEQLLPADIKQEWTRKARGCDDDRKFEELVKFLIEQRQVIEYMDDELRFGKIGASHLESENLRSLTQIIR